MDVGHNVIDKFNSNGEALTPITGPFEGPLRGVGVDANGSVRVAVPDEPANFEDPATDVFDNAAANGFVKRLQARRTGTGGLIHDTIGLGFAAGSPPGSGYAVFSCFCVVKLGADGEKEISPVDEKEWLEGCCGRGRSGERPRVRRRTVVGHRELGHGRAERL